MKNHLLSVTAVLALAALSALSAPPASAITLESAVTQGGTVVADFSGVSLASFDIDFANFGPAQLGFRVDAGDMDAPIALNAVLRNFTGAGFSGFSLSLDRGSFTTIGSVTPQFGGTATTSVAGATANIGFSTLEFLDVEIGDALGTTPGATNWVLGGLVAGDRFTLTVTAVPEPGTYALLLAGLGALGFIVRRRRN